MNSPIRSLLAGGVAVVTIGAGVTVPPPAVTPVAQVHTDIAAAVAVTALVPPAVQPVADYLQTWVERVVIPPSAGAPFPTPDFPPVVAPTSIGSTIKNVYNTVEPWVQYGFEIATYAVGWIPWVGWLSPQIMIFYHFGERIVRSIAFNIADWLDGNVSFVEGLVNVGVDTVNSFIQLGIDEWNFWLPPLPPLPPLTQVTTAVEPSTDTAADPDPVTARDAGAVRQTRHAAETVTDVVTETEVVDDAGSNTPADIPARTARTAATDRAEVKSSIATQRSGARGKTAETKSGNTETTGERTGATHQSNARERAATSAEPDSHQPSSSDGTKTRGSRAHGSDRN